ncbi:unnamed protein product [Diamesa tonsa]
MDIKWLVLVFFNGFNFIHCMDCDSDELLYLAKIDITLDESSQSVHHGVGSLIHPYYILTAGSFVFDFYKVNQYADDSKYPAMKVWFPKSDVKGFFKVEEVIIIKQIYDPLTSDFALIKLKDRSNIKPGYLGAEYKKTEKILKTSKKYHLGSLGGNINIWPTDPDSILTSFIIESTSDDEDYSIFDENSIGAPLFYCDQDRGYYVQAGIFSKFGATKKHQRSTNLLMLTEPIYNFIAEQSFSKCYEENARRINEGETRFHNRAQLGDSIVHIYATTYSNEMKPSQRRCSGSFITESTIITSATCVQSYVKQRTLAPVLPENYEYYENMKYKMIINVGFKDEVNHPNALINERDIEYVKLHQEYDPQTGAADVAIIKLIEVIDKLLDKNEEIHLTPFLVDGKVEDFDGEIVMFVGIDRKGNTTTRDIIGSALYRVDQVSCKDHKDAELCITSQFIAPWRVPQNINVGGTFYSCDWDLKFKQIAMLTKQEGYVSKAVWLPNYSFIG